jgi:hypothetical protein
MNLLTYIAKRFKVPLTHVINRCGKETEYSLVGIAFTKLQLIASYGEENEPLFEVVIRGQS